MNQTTNTNANQTTNETPQRKEQTMTNVRTVLKELADTVSHKGDTWTARRGMFYTKGYSGEKFASRCLDALKEAGFTNARVLDCGEKWVDFRGGASVRNQSHWWVVIEVLPNAQ